MRQLNPDEHEIYDDAQGVRRGRHDLRPLRAGAQKSVHCRSARSSADRQRRLERRHEPRGNRRKGRERVARVVPDRDAAGNLPCTPSVAATTRCGDEVRAKADAYAEAVEKSAWDGEWYRRAYFDDGSPLGSRTSDECKIDSIAQSWSVISGAGQPDRVKTAMESLNKYLVREDARLIMLLTPPFDKTTHDPGYIQGYLPGVRENGAQYTHAALWAVLATALQGDGDRAFELFQMLNPITHADSAEGGRHLQGRALRRCRGCVHRRRATSVAAAGRGTPGQRAGCIASRSKAILGFHQRGEQLLHRTVHSRRAGSSSPSSIGTDRRRTRSRSRTRMDYNPAPSQLTVDGQTAGEAIDLVDDGKHHRVTASLAPSASSAPEKPEKVRL